MKNSFSPKFFPSNQLYSFRFSKCVAFTKSLPKNLRNFLTMSGLQFWSDKEEQYLGMNEKYVNIIFQFLIKYTVYLHHLVN